MAGFETLKLKSRITRFGGCNGDVWRTTQHTGTGGVDSALKPASYTILS